MLTKYDNCEREYKRHKKLKRKDALAILEWADKQEHFPKITEYQVLFSLYGCDYSIEQAKISLEKFLTLRTNSPEIFQNRTEDVVKSVFKTFLFGKLPKKSPKGHIMAISKVIDTDPSKYHCANTYKVAIMALTLTAVQLGLESDQIMIFDMAGLSLAHSFQLSFSAVRAFANAVDIIAVKLREIHIINANFLVDIGLRIFGPYINPRFYKILYIHSVMDTFFKYVPQELMPEEYGGKAGSISEINESMMNNLLRNMDYFRAEEHQVVDESKRAKNYTLLDLIGDVNVKGSFRKLDID